MGPISPAEFIPVAEETGAIIALGEYDRDDGSLYFIEDSGDEVYEYRLLRD